MKKSEFLLQRCGCSLFTAVVFVFPHHLLCKHCHLRLCLFILAVDVEDLVSEAHEVSLVILLRLVEEVAGLGSGLGRSSELLLGDLQTLMHLGGLGLHCIEVGSSLRAGLDQLSECRLQGSNRGRIIELLHTKTHETSGK